MRPGFRSDTEAVVEHGWGVGEPARSRRSEGASASYHQLGPQAARVDVVTSGPAVLVVRNAFDPHWRATVDGRPAKVFPSNYVVQGVRVPAGRHTVVLTYDDPWVGYGLLASALAILAMALSALLLSSRFRPRPRESPTSEGANAVIREGGDESR